MSIEKELRKIVILKRDAIGAFNSQMERPGECYYKSRCENRDFCRSAFIRFRENIDIMFPEEDGFLHIEYYDLINNQTREVKRILDYWGFPYNAGETFTLPHLRGW